MKIITGYQGRAHIASKDDQGRNRGMMGAASYVLGGVNTFAATLVSNNELQIGAGEGIHQGVHFRVEPGSYDSLTIENGTQGKKRKDLIVCRYTKDSSTGVENTAWVVIKGTPADSNPVRPAYTSGDIASGAATADMPFYELTIDGINVTAVTPLFSVLKTMKELQDQAQTNANAIASLNSSLGTIYSEDGTVSVVNGTFTTVCTMSLPAGIYVITGDIAFSGTETTGIRILILDTAETGSNSYSNSTLATGRADIGKTRIVGLTGSTTLYLRAYQTSGGTMICNGRIRAIRIK